VASFFENNDADMLNGYLLIIDKSSRILSNFFVLRAKKRLAQKGIYYMTQQSMFWKRNIFEKVGFLRDDFHALMDQEFLIRVFEKDLKIGHIEKILGAIRRHEMTKSSILGPIWSDDRKKLDVMYNGTYGQKPATMSKLLYGLEKLMNGLYFKHWAFILKWKGRKINDLEKENCVYL
jgi:GT2 family glycosyltransferase